MFGIFDAVEDAVSNVIDVGVGVATFGEYGDLNQRNISKMISDGIEIYTIASLFDVSTDVIEKLVEN